METLCKHIDEDCAGVGIRCCSQVKMSPHQDNGIKTFPTGSSNLGPGNETAQAVLILMQGTETLMTKSPLRQSRTSANIGPLQIHDQYSL